MTTEPLPHNPGETGTGPRYGILLASIVLALVLWNTLPFPAPIVTGLTLLTFIGLLWLTEAIHVTITALLVPVLAVLLGVTDTGQALSFFADPIIFLFLGGFALAAALHSQDLDKAIAHKMLQLAAGRFSVAVILLFLVSAGLSMWISNTATTAMMLPLTLGVLHQLNQEERRSTYVFVLLGVAYSASIGGIATLVGSPPNAIAAVQNNFTFYDWMVLAGPLSLILLPVTLGVLWLVIRPQLNDRISASAGTLQWTRQRILTLLIFALTVIGWVFGGPLNQWLGPFAKPDTLVAVTAIILLAVSGVVSWKDIEKTTDWSVLLLFGGGLCLSGVLKSSGTSVFLAENIAALLGNASPLLILLSLVTFVVFLTEFASNTASAALLIPVFAAIAEGMGLSPVMLTTVTAVAASCAFMLPVATPPNAIVFGSGYIRQQEMMKAGLWINLSCIAIIVLYARLFW